MKKKDTAAHLSTLSKKELLTRAGELRLPRRHSLKKSELISAIAAALQALRPAHPAPAPAGKPVRRRRRTVPVAEVVAMAVDQHRIHCYWDGAPESKGSHPPAPQAVLRVRETTGAPSGATDAVRTYDIGIIGTAGSRYVDLPLPGRTYCVELGVLDANGYHPLASAPAVRLPQASPDVLLPKVSQPDRQSQSSPVSNEASAWHIADADFQQLYDLSGVTSLRLGGQAAADESLSSPGLTL